MSMHLCRQIQLENTDHDNILVEVISTKYLIKINFLETEKLAFTYVKYILDHRYFLKIVYVGSSRMLKGSLTYMDERITTYR